MRSNSINNNINGGNISSFNLTLPEWVATITGFLWSGALAVFEIITLVGIKDNKNLGALKPFPGLVLV